MFLILTAKTKLTNNKTKTPTKTNKKPATKLGMHIQIADLLKKVCLCWAFVKSKKGECRAVGTESRGGP